MQENDEFRSLLSCVRHKNSKNLTFPGKGQMNLTRKGPTQRWGLGEMGTFGYIADKISACNCQRRENRFLARVIEKSENPGVQEVGISNK